jgi:hypothetical protein
MLLASHSIVVKKMLLNIFFSTFSILGRHQACDTATVVPAPKAPVHSSTEKDLKPKKSNAIAPGFERTLVFPAGQGCPKRTLGSTPIKY